MRLLLVLALMLCSAVPALAGHTTVAPVHKDDLRRTPVVRAVEAVAPAVVNITSARVVEREVNPLGRLFEDRGLPPLFREFFGPQGTRRFTQTNLGSGVVFDGHEGLVLTNAHVISGATEITARLLDGREFKAELVGSDPDFDLAVLRLEGASDLPQVRVGSSLDLLIGETVIAIGNPFGFSHTVTTGVLSAVGRTVRTEQGTFTDFLQTDTAINPGNSGGPLLNIHGELIGVNTAIHKGAEGIGFAIPIDKAKRVVAEILDQGFVSQVWLGLSGQNIDQPTAGYFGLSAPRGMLVTDVYKDGPAARAGLRPGDVVQQMGGNTVEDKDHYMQLLRNYTRGERVALTVFRDGSTLGLDALADAFPLGLVGEMAWARWGLRTGDATQDGLAVGAVRRGSPGAAMGLVPGDVLLKVGGVRLGQPSDFVAAFVRYRMQNGLLFVVWRAGRVYYVRLNV